MLTKSDVSRFRSLVVRSGQKKLRTDLVDVGAKSILTVGSTYIFRKEKFLSNAIIGAGAHALGFIAKDAKGIEPVSSVLHSIGDGVMAALALNCGRKLGMKLAKEDAALKQIPIK